MVKWELLKRSPTESSWVTTKWRKPSIGCKRHLAGSINTRIYSDFYCSVVAIACSIRLWNVLHNWPIVSLTQTLGISVWQLGQKDKINQLSAIDISRVSVVGSSFVWLYHGDRGVIISFGETLWELPSHNWLGDAEQSSTTEVETDIEILLEARGIQADLQQLYMNLNCVFGRMWGRAWFYRPILTRLHLRRRQNLYFSHQNNRRRVRLRMN